jgi:hypothetical protein
LNPRERAPLRGLNGNGNGAVPSIGSNIFTTDSTSDGSFPQPTINLGLSPIPPVVTRRQFVVSVLRVRWRRLRNCSTKALAPSSLERFGLEKFGVTGKSSVDIDAERSTTKTTVYTL